MACFDVTLASSNDPLTGSPKPERVNGADAYQQEGPLTTFFAVDGDRQVIDSWSTRVASFRTADIRAIRRADEAATDDAAADRAPGELALGELALVQTA